MDAARQLGKKRSREDAHRHPSAPSQQQVEEEMARLTKRRRVMMLQRPDEMRFSNDTPVTREDALRSLARKREKTQPGAHKRQPVAPQSPNVETDKETAVDLPELAEAQKKQKREDTVKQAVGELVQSLCSFETLNAITTNWLVASMPNGHHCMRHVADLLRYIITQPVRLRLFYTAGERRDELHLFGRHAQFHVPFSLLSDRAKVLLAFMMSKQALFFQKIERHARGVCGRVYSEFVFDSALDVAVVEASFREQLLRHTLLSVLRHANQRHNIAAAVSAVISMGSEIAARDVAMQRVGGIVRSARELRLRDTIERGLHSMFGMLLNARQLSLDLCDFTKRVEACAVSHFTPRIGNVPIMPAAPQCEAVRWGAASVALKHCCDVDECDEGDGMVVDAHRGESAVA